MLDTRRLTICSLVSYPFDPERDIATERLRLIWVRPELLIALISGPANFTALTGWPVAEAYMDFPGALEFSLEQWESGAADPDFWMYLMLLPAAGNTSEGEVIGLIGYKGGPQPATGNRVEIGYSVAPAHQNCGYATEATAAIVDRAFRHEVESVTACTLAEQNSSCRVLERNGFSMVEELADPEEGTIWRWERKREA